LEEIKCLETRRRTGGSQKVTPREHKKTHQGVPARGPDWYAVPLDSRRPSRPTAVLYCRTRELFVKYRSISPHSLARKTSGIGLACVFCPGFVWNGVNILRLGMLQDRGCSKWWKFSGFGSGKNPSWGYNHRPGPDDTQPTGFRNVARRPLCGPQRWSLKSAPGDGGTSGGRRAAPGARPTGRGGGPRSARGPPFIEPPDEESKLQSYTRIKNGAGRQQL